MKITKRPNKLQVRVSSEMHHTICRIAELSDQTVSVCVNELLESILPGLKKTLEYLETASKLDSKGKEHLTKTLQEQEKQLREKLESVSEIVESEFRQHKLPL